MAEKGILRSRWNNGGWSSPLDHPDRMEMFPREEIQTAMSRTQPISKGYKNGEDQSKVAKSKLEKLLSASVSTFA
jgi:hypothetical protein